MIKLLVIFSLSLAGLVFAFTENEEQNVDYQVRAAIADIINDTLNALIRNSSDPLTINELSMNFENNSLLSGGLNITKLRINGIHEIVAPYIDVQIFSEVFNMSVNIPNLDISFKYWLDTLVGGVVPLYGSGLNSIFFEGITVNASGKVDVLGKQLHNITANLWIDHAVFNMDGFLNNPEFSALVNLMLNDNFCEFIKDYQEFVSRVISGFISALLDSLK
ncbi:unnamed protein product [Phaedon cochleariae]|uniref:Uncharacterized protein n=1 Tax=Phaedon cochleariae TaxID=80249 RepID=A0A9P0DP17_PHACE|nr:unnamed protein product [Phaedon cochleariae]